MVKTVFRISKMDCASEEQLIRMKLSGLEGIDGLEFDLQKRQLTVYHSGSADQVFEKLNELNLGASLIGSVSAAEYQGELHETVRERKMLRQVLAINLLFFVLELSAGFIANSMGLVADSLDMLADSIVYGLALLAVGGSVVKKKRIAGAAGYFQLALAVAGFMEVIRRFTGRDAMPGFQTMIIISTLALAGNSLCLYILQKSRSKEAHMRASMIFTSNDVIANLGVIAAGVLVYITNSSYPDLVIGSIVFILVGRGAIQILQLAK